MTAIDFATDPTPSISLHKSCQVLVNLKRSGYEVTIRCGNPAKHVVMVNPSTDKYIRLCDQHFSKLEKPLRHT